jgi:hypothetical protein
VSLQFNYQIPVWRTYLGAGSCILFAVGVGYFSYFNQKGLRLFRVITFTPSEASMLYWSLTILLVFAFALFVMLAIRSSKGPIVILLEDEWVVAPRASIRNDLLSIPYAAIGQVLVQKIQHEEMVTINSSVGQARVMAMGFDSHHRFEEFKQALAGRINR